MEAPARATVCMVAKSPKTTPLRPCIKGRHDNERSTLRVHFNCTGEVRLFIVSSASSVNGKVISQVNKCTRFKNKTTATKDEHVAWSTCEARRNNIIDKIFKERRKAMTPSTTSPALIEAKTQQAIDMANSLRLELEREDKMTETKTVANKTIEPRYKVTPSGKPSGDPERSAPADATKECGERTVSSTGKALICVADTGSAHHIRGQKDIPPDQANRIEEAEVPLSLTTANGTIPVTQKIATKITRLGCTKDMYVLEELLH